ncbi:MAG TPA: M56 family metallopeptidase [Terriglobales bacterium]|jgi:beta-lactamase regulating signal transducer with metallopeptidase domain
MIIDFHQVAQISTQGVVNTMAQGVAIALFAHLLLKVMGRGNSRTKFAVWFCTLLAIVMLPFVSLIPNRPLIASTPAPISMPKAWALYALGAWVLISFFALMRVAVGLWHLAKLRRNCVPIDVDTLDPLLQQTIAEAQASRKIAIHVSEVLQVPTAVGFTKPAVIVPRWALEELSTVELNAVLLHELAHLRRWDDWTNLAQKVFRALFFFHPAIWWIEKQLSTEREMACDELVLAKTDARAYAECLVLLAERNFMRRGIALAQAAVHRASETAKRLAQILDRNQRGTTLISKSAVVAVIVFAGGCLALVPHMPPIVAFSGEVPQLTVASTSRPAPAIIPIQKENTEVKVVAAKYKAPEAENTRRPATTSLKTKPARKQETNAVRLARINAPAHAPVPYPTFVVMQTRQQYDEAGPNGTVWTFTVWRVTVIRQQPAEPMEPAMHSKST